MKIMLANRYLQSVADLLEAMPLKAAQSRARSKLLILVRDALARFAEDEYDLVAAYATHDAENQPVFSDDGTFALSDPAQAGEFHAARTQLLDSLAEVSGPTYDGHETALRDLLDSYDEPLSGQTAEAYDVLYDALSQATP